MNTMTASMRLRRRALFGFGAMALAGCVAVSSNLQARPAANAVPVASTNITEAEVLAAQQAWVAALVQISSDFASGGQARAKATAERVLDSAYAYNMGPVLFKPTLTVAPQTFRTTRDGALAYFVGGDPNFPKDDGFALKGWTGGEMQNVAIQLHGNVAIAQGNVTLRNKDGSSVTVDKTFGYVKDSAGNLRIILHHSSLPYSGG